MYVNPLVKSRGQSWFYEGLQLQTRAVYWGSDKETETLTCNNVIHLLQGSLQHVAGIWGHGSTLCYKAALVETDR